MHEEANTGVTTAISHLHCFKQKMINLGADLRVLLSLNPLCSPQDPGTSPLAENANANKDKCKLYSLDQHLPSSGNMTPSV